MPPERLFRSGSRRSRLRAFSLIEVVLALGVVAVAALALIGILGSSLGSAREISGQFRAVNAVSALDGALAAPNGMFGLSGGPTLAPFDRIYATLSAKGALNGRNFVDFIVSSNGAAASGAGPYEYIHAPQPTVTVLTGTPSLQDALTSGRVAHGDNLRLRVRVSKLLDGKLVTLDPATYEPMATAWSFGTNLPGSANGYALAYLPLVVEVYPIDYSAATDPGNDPDPAKAKVPPILVQTLVMTR